MGCNGGCGDWEAGERGTLTKLCGDGSGASVTRVVTGRSWRATVFAADGEVVATRTAHTPLAAAERADAALARVEQIYARVVRLNVARRRRGGRVTRRRTTTPPRADRVKRR